MSDSIAKPATEDAAKGSWGELFTGGRGLYSALIIGGIAMHATQVLVIAIIMPTIIGDIGGAAYYTWASMLYTIGAIVGASSTGAVWSKFGARKGYALGALVFAISTTACALAPDMFTLITARGIQGWAGGLVSGGGTALIASLYDARLRTRILAIAQGTFTACHLGGPIVGGVFASIHWWRGSFWLMVPFMLAFVGVALRKIPARLDTEAERSAVPPFPFFRLTMLTAGVFAIAATGPVESFTLRALLIAAAVALVTLTFRLDREAGNKIFPSHALSLSVPIGLCLWVLTMHAMAQTSVTLFLPLLLQVVARSLARIHQFRHHRDLAGLDRRQLFGFRLVGRARAHRLGRRAGDRLCRAVVHHHHRAHAGARAPDLRCLHDGAWCRAL
jgi:MFS family permease